MASLLQPSATLVFRAFLSVCQTCQDTTPSDVFFKQRVSFKASVEVM